MKTQKIRIQNAFQSNINYATIHQTPSAFGIPKRLIPVLAKKIRKNGSLRNYLHILLKNYKIFAFSGELPQGNGVKLKYQKNEQLLEYFRFRPNSSDWIELRMLAHAHSVSMSLFFVFLLEMDKSEMDTKLKGLLGGKVPTDMSKDEPIRLRIHLLRRKQERHLRMKFGKPLEIQLEKRRELVGKIQGYTELPEKT